MSPAQLKKVQRIFARASQLTDPEARNAYVKAASRGQDKVRAEVESLLRHTNSGPFLGIPTSVDGKVLSHYKVLEPVGEGGMGIVYKALDMRLNRLVVLKVLPAWMSGDPRAKRRLVREAKLASALNHPNVVTVHDIAHENGVDFIVMEYVDGRTLASLIPPKGLAASQALSYAIQIAEGLAAIHAAGILHDDLKPLNVMVAKERVKLVDFGLAKALAPARSDSSETGPSGQFGTRLYMAPERLLRDADPRSEVYSFGLILHQMLSGAHPFGGDRTQARERANPLPPKVPRELAVVVQRCLEPRPDKRFQSMADVIEALHAVRSDVGRPARRATVSTRKPRHSPEQSAKIRAIAKRVDAGNLVQSRRALAQLEGLLREDATPAVRQAVIPALRNLILKNYDLEGRGVAASVREMRQEALHVLTRTVHGDFHQAFDNQDFVHLDLFGMNFDAARLADFSFRGCFLVAATFRQSDLTRASFAQASIRNVHFAGADVTGADFTDADWFNALGWTEGQLKAARRETLSQAPADEEGMRQYLSDHYVFPFDSWPARIQNELLQTWREYLQPGGLRDVVIRWQRDF